MPIQAVLFDLWGTLIIDRPDRFEPRQKQRADSVLAVLDRSGISTSFVAVDSALRQTQVDLNALHDTGVDVASPGRVELFLERLDPPLIGRLPAAAHDAIGAAISAMPPDLAPEVAPAALETLTDLGQFGLRLGLVSNTGFTTGVVVRGMIAAFGLASHFAHTTWSDELGVAKPEPRTFQDALAGVGVRPEAAVYVGDSPHNDIFGARRAGLVAIQIGHKGPPPATGYAANESAIPHARIDSLPGLLPALRRLGCL